MRDTGDKTQRRAEIVGAERWTRVMARLGPSLADGASGGCARMGKGNAADGWARGTGEGARRGSDAGPAPAQLGAAARTARTERTERRGGWR